MLLNLPQNSVSGLVAEIIISLIIMAMMSFLAVFIGYKANRADPLKRPKGILIAAEWAVEKLDAYAEDVMGKDLGRLSPYFGALAVYIFVSFTISIVGVPSPITNLMVPLSLSICSFLLIHITGAYYNRWKYLKRYLIPINLISMWAPVISLTFRMFGNALIGLILMTLAYAAMEGISNMIFNNPYVIVPIFAPFLHAYFDIFTAFIQTLVFMTLSMLFISQENPHAEDEESSAKEIKEKITVVSPKAMRNKN